MVQRYRRGEFSQQIHGIIAGSSRVRVRCNGENLNRKFKKLPLASSFGDRKDTLVASGHIGEDVWRLMVAWKM